jgi:predicted CoA-binding protein
MNSKKTLVLGASPNPDRAAFQAVARLVKNNHEVIPFGIRKGNVEGIPIINELPAQIENLDTVTLYINPTAQENYRSYLLKLKPKRVIFNPGTENKNLAQELNQNGIETLFACTLVMLSLKNY